MSSDNQDANQLIIESVPLGGMTRRLIDPHQATQIRAKIALALGMDDEELAKKLAHFQRNGYPLDAYEQVREYDIPIANFGAEGPQLPRDDMPIITGDMPIAQES